MTEKQALRKYRRVLKNLSKEEFALDEIQVIAGKLFNEPIDKAENLPISDVSLSFPFEDTFNVGFDEGYTSPLERDGSSVTIKNYEEHRKECYDTWRSLIARNEG